jgi:LacI family transcriptional regulator
MRKKERASQKTIANTLGYSISTVSRVLSGKYEKYRISDETANLILKTAEDLGYVPDELARSLKTNKSNTIGLIIPDIANPHFASIAKIIENEARKSGYSIVLSDSQESSEGESESIHLLKSRRVDGIIICPVGSNSTDLKRIIELNIPLVVADRTIKGLKCPFVVSDNYRGALEAVRHLVQMNHRSIACIQGKTDTSVNDERVRGFRDAHVESSIPLDEKLIVGDNFGKRNGYIWTKIILKRNPRPTAILGLSNLISLGAIKAIYENGLSIPEDISLICFDEQPYSAYMRTPMTTIAQQTNEIGQIAFNLLISKINDVSHGDKNEDGVIIPTELIVRDSVLKLDVEKDDINKNKIKFTEELKNI